MEKEMNEAAAAGYSFRAVMGGETGFGGKEVVIVMSKVRENMDQYFQIFGIKNKANGELDFSESPIVDSGNQEKLGKMVKESQDWDSREEVLTAMAVHDPWLLRWGMSAGRKTYKLLAANKTSTLQKELQQAGDEGFEYLGQTVLESFFGGKEVSVILERNLDAPPKRYAYKLLATFETSTMQKELQEAGEVGFEFLGMTVGKTAFGGKELVCFLRREIN
jgi:hypothetical protein